jgi:hypothetical protein
MKRQAVINPFARVQPAMGFSPSELLNRSYKKLFKLHHAEGFELSSMSGDNIFFAA